MKSISASEIAASLNHIGIICQSVLEGNPHTLEHGEVSIKARKPMTVFVSPVDDTLYLAVWHPVKTRKHVEADDGTYTYSNIYHYAGQFHRLIRAIRQPSQANRRTL